MRTTKCKICKGTGSMLKSHPDYVEGGLCVECGGTGVVYETNEKYGKKTFTQTWIDIATNDTQEWDEGVDRE